MGLDIVELVMRCEEVFCVDLPDKDLEAARTVGDLYLLIAHRLGLRGVPAEHREAGGATGPLMFRRAGFIGSPPPEDGRSRLDGVLKLNFAPWSEADIWATLVAIFVDQLALEPEEVRFEARIVDDLGVC